MGLARKPQAVNLAADVRYPRLFQPAWPGAAAALLVLGSATALLAYRPADGRAAAIVYAFDTGLVDPGG